LLTAVRRQLLVDLPAERFRDRAVFALMLALATQCLNNEHIWAESDEEREALQALTVDRDALVGGDPDAARRLALSLLYQPVSAGPASDLVAADCTRIRPKGLAELLQARLRDREEERALAVDIPQIGTIDDETSLRVAGQYEASPYPRWTSMHVPQAGSLRRALARYFDEERLQVMDNPFKVLIAGAGTGSQAVLAAHAYGEKAEVLGIDLSRASLAYGARMAGKFDARNLKFMQADILGLSELDQTFDVIECVGVLHHMADPIAGWRALLDRLKPGGLMLIALYSATSRRNIRALRDDPAYPGAGCSNEDARAFRQMLMSRPVGEPGTELLTSSDFYTLSEFRDLVLHESEQQFTIEEISDFLNANGLTFCGFTLPPHVFEHVQVHYKEEVWPGSLERWAAVEADHPNMFDGMYQFWCEKVA
jgi:SAM-dependent methyltransferase